MALLLLNIFNVAVGKATTQPFMRWIDNFADISETGSGGEGNSTTLQQMSGQLD
jgi:hypothetical protein